MELMYLFDSIMYGLTILTLPFGLLAENVKLLTVVQPLEQIRLGVHRWRWALDALS